MKKTYHVIHQKSKKLILVLFDILSVILSTFSSMILLKVGLKENTSFLLIFIPVMCLIEIIIYRLFNLYNSIWEYAGLYELVTITLSGLIVWVILFVFGLITNNQYIPARMAFVYAMMMIILEGASRLFVRVYRGFKTGSIYVLPIQKRIESTKVMVIGAGDAGAAIIKELMTSEKVHKTPVCLIDDDPDKLGTMLYGVKVKGDRSDIKYLAKHYDVDEIIVALPSLGKRELAEILNICEDTSCKVQVLPGMYQLVNGQVSTSNLRDVEIKDLLGRDEVKVNLDEIMKYIESKVVLVTGGGGSIGSELCRQIATHNPKQLIILDIYENNAYDIEQELKRRHPELNLLALIASIRDKGKLEDVFKKYKIDIVFNAAAHKHVPLMETSPNEAIKNNVFGTLNLATLSDKYKVKRFIQISTDKAVNPTNIMGASKRICEMIIQTVGRKSKTTEFVAVRFGNVLGSNGSVIPLFRKQIAEGGPVTVTDKNIVRYFMTIPEAVSLVLQAGAYAKGGEIYVLDMGKPVRIYDLALKMIKLSGLTLGKDIEIKFTGLRPGEKLYEERLMDEEGLKKTANGSISVAKPIELDEANFFNTLDELYTEAYKETDSMKELVRKLVPTYTIDKRN